MTNDLFFDTDCLSAFLWINNTNLLELLYGGRIVIPAPVYQELSNPSVPHIRQRADILISGNQAAVKQLDVDTEEYSLYRRLVNGGRQQKAIGKGEAAGIALAKTYHGILASNNWRDVGPYIEKYHLRHVDTGHILVQGLKAGYITVADGNIIWQQMLHKRRKLPAFSFSDYIKTIS